jgi:hypothetical protein
VADLSNNSIDSRQLKGYNIFNSYKNEEREEEK